jgi:branched-chain amino acid transport system substrate-binding protein
MTFKLKTLAAAAALALAAGGAHAQISGNVVKIGVLNDQSSLYADLGGQGSVLAAKMAIEDFKAKDKGLNVEVIFADHQNKPDVGTQIANKWIDAEGVDVIVDVPNSGVALAVNEVVRTKGKVFINSGAASSDLTGAKCSPNTVHWTYDTWMLANGTGKAIVKTGGDTWFFITADYAFGHALERDTSEVVKANGGKVLGAVRHPLNTQDFSSFLLQAQSSKAKVIGLANAGGDTINSIKAANEFGITKTMKLAGLLMFINDVHSLGLKATQGMYLTDSWYWNRDPEARAWSRRFFEKVKRMPSSLQAADYSVALQYLNAVKAVNSDDPDKVLAQLRKMKFNDIFAKGGWIRGDGSMIHDMYLMQVKSPDKSTEPWDYYNVVQTFKGEEAWTTKAETKCSLWK